MVKYIKMLQIDSLRLQLPENIDFTMIRLTYNRYFFVSNIKKLGNKGIFQTQFFIFLFNLSLILKYNNKHLTPS